MLTHSSAIVKALPGQLAVHFPTPASVQAAHMPFIDGEGLFIQTTAAYTLGEALTLSLTFFNHPQPLLAQAKIVWITPIGAQGGKPPGLGLQWCGGDLDTLRRQIAFSLAEKNDPNGPTDTL